MYSHNHGQANLSRNQNSASKLQTHACSSSTSGDIETRAINDGGDGLRWLLFSDGAVLRVVKRFDISDLVQLPIHRVRCSCKVQFQNSAYSTQIDSSCRIAVCLNWISLAHKDELLGACEHVSALHRWQLAECLEENHGSSVVRMPA